MSASANSDAIVTTGQISTAILRQYAVKGKFFSPIGFTVSRPSIAAPLKENRRR